MSTVEMSIIIFASPSRALCDQYLETWQTIAVVWPIAVVGFKSL